MSFLLRHPGTCALSVPTPDPDPVRFPFPPELHFTISFGGPFYVSDAFISSCHRVTLAG